jgi:hypothetical protein
VSLKTAPEALQLLRDLYCSLKLIVSPAFECVSGELYRVIRLDAASFKCVSIPSPEAHDREAQDEAVPHCEPSPPQDLASGFRANKGRQLIFFHKASDRLAGTRGVLIDHKTIRP